MSIKDIIVAIIFGVLALWVAAFMLFIRKYGVVREGEDYDDTS
jgi:hypothetical protein